MPTTSQQPFPDNEKLEYRTHQERIVVCLRWHSGIVMANIYRIEVPAARSLLKLNTKALLAFGRLKVDGMTFYGTKIMNSITLFRR